MTEIVLDAPPPVHAADANILLRLVQESHPHHAIVRSAWRSLRHRGVQIVTVPQTIYEFYAVATRSAEARGGLGLEVEQAMSILRRFEQLCPVRNTNAELVYAKWKEIVRDSSVIGKQTHDARIVAAMKVEGITHLLTFNGSDFKRFEATEMITVIDPNDVPRLIENERQKRKR